MASDRIRRDKTKINILLDTSMILSLFEYSFNLDKELERLLGLYEILVPSVVIKELKRLSKGDDTKAINASAALKLISRYKIIYSDDANADDAIIHITNKNKKNIMVATNDRHLRTMLKEIGVPVIILRKKRILHIDE
ncbi:MAG: PIN domain-containing protein [Candidatus Thermoplasmatota archaeon]